LVTAGEFQTNFTVPRQFAQCRQFDHPHRKTHDHWLTEKSAEPIWRSKAASPDG
jgi:hypothetical protein